MRVTSTLFVIVVCLMPLCANASGWHAFTRPAKDASDLISAVHASRWVTPAAFRLRINHERRLHGQQPLENDASLNEYLLHGTHIVPCERVYHENDVVAERTDGRGTFDTWSRACKPGENILVDNDTARPVVSLDCGNVIQTVPQPVVEAPKQRPCTYVGYTTVTDGGPRGYVGIPLGMAPAASAAVSAVAVPGVAVVSVAHGAGVSIGMGVYPSLGNRHETTYTSVECR
jgi:hypothetical protein